MNLQGPTQNRLIHLANELGVEFCNVHNEGKHIAEVCGQRSAYSGSYPIFGLLSLLDLNRLLCKVYSMSSQLDCTDPSSHPQAVQWDSISVEEWLERECFTQVSAALCSAAVETILGFPSRISLLFWLLFCKRGGGMLRLAEVRQGAQERLMVGGAHSLCQKVFDRFTENVRTEFSVKVVEVEQSEGVVIVRGLKGEEMVVYKCSSLILCVPPALQTSISFVPELPKHKITASATQSATHILKTFLIYKKRWWKEKGFSGRLQTQISLPKSCSSFFFVSISLKRGC